MNEANSSFFERRVLSTVDPSKVLSIDLETLVEGGGFLTGERIIAVSLSRGYPSIGTEVLIAEDESPKEENRILSELDSLLGQIQPSVIIGYNHTGYDIPLLHLKMRGRPYREQLWNLKYSLGTAYTLDMMYVIAHDLQDFGEDFRIRKLRDVVNHERYSSLPLIRAKDLVVSSTMNVAEVIKELWKTNRDDFRRYCAGDTHDILKIFQKLFLEA